MTVKELITVLEGCDPELPIATYALGHVYASKGDAQSHGVLRVVQLNHYSGDHVLIGDVSRRKINPPNWYVTGELDGGGRIPDNWGEWRD